MLDGPPFNTVRFVSRDTCVSSSKVYRHIGKNEPFCILKTPNGRSYSFQNLTRLSHGKNAVDLRE